VAGLLGVHVGKNPNGSIELTQVSLMDRIIGALGLEQDKSTGKPAPAEYGCLKTNADDEDCNETFNYRSVVGMTQYLYGHTRPDIAFAVSQCARFSSNPKRIHDEALKRIGRYLLQTRDRGLLLNPMDSFKIGCFVNAYFAGLCSYEDPNYPVCVRTRTGFVICICGCPVSWITRLQTKIALSTMESEYVSLSTAMRELIPLKAAITEIASGMDLADEKIVTIKSTIREDTMGDLTLANMELSCTTPQSKHYYTRYPWFRSFLNDDGDGGYEVIKIASADQMAEILTKALIEEPFRRNNLLVMGW
jgi:hypothetical protein